MCSAEDYGDGIAQTKDLFSLFLITKYTFYQIKDFNANFQVHVYICQLYTSIFNSTSEVNG